MSYPSVKKIWCSHATPDYRAPTRAFSEVIDLELEDAHACSLGLLGLLERIKALEYLRIQWCEHVTTIGRYNRKGPLRSALAVQQHSLRHLDLTTFGSTLQKTNGEARDVLQPIGSLKEFVKLETLKIDEDLLMGSDHEEQERNWAHLALEDILPQGLKEFEVHSASTICRLAVILPAMSKFKSEALTSFTAHFLHQESLQVLKILLGIYPQEEHGSYTFQVGTWRGFDSMILHYWQTPHLWEWFEQCLQRITGCAERVAMRLVDEMIDKMIPLIPSMDVMVGLLLQPGGLTLEQDVIEASESEGLNNH